MTAFMKRALDNATLRFKNHIWKRSFKKILFYSISFTFFLLIFKVHFIIMYITGAEEFNVIFSV